MAAGESNRRQPGAHPALHQHDAFKPFKPFAVRNYPLLTTDGASFFALAHRAQARRKMYVCELWYFGTSTPDSYMQN